MASSADRHSEAAEPLLAPEADHFDLFVIFTLVALYGMQGLEPFIRVPILALPPDGADELFQVFVRRTTPQQGLQIMPSFGEEAGDQLAVCCEPGAGAA